MTRHPEASKPQPPEQPQDLEAAVTEQAHGLAGIVSEAPDALVDVANEELSTAGLRLIRHDPEKSSRDALIDDAASRVEERLKLTNESQEDRLARRRRMAITLRSRRRN